MEWILVILILVAIEGYRQLRFAFRRIRYLEATVIAAHVTFNEDEYFAALDQLKKQAPWWWR
jgi:hypothetical protein